MNTLVRLFAIVTSTLIIHTSALAQTTYEDVVYLKNGSIIHGMIIEQVPNQSIKIQTVDHNVFVYKMDEVEKITKEAVANSSRPEKSSNSQGKFKERGYLNITEFSGGIGNTFSFGLQTVNGYLFNPYVSLGLGVGVDKYENTTFLPIFADFRVYFLDKAVTPYFAGAIGYSLVFQTGNGGGLFANPSIGMRFSATPKFALDFSTGFRLQQSTYNYIDYYYGNYVHSYKTSDYQFDFKVGVSL